MAETNIDAETVHLEVENELLLTVHKPGDKITVQLVIGSAEVFGSQLQINKQYEFSYFSSVTIFTWHGCTLMLKTEGSKKSKYQIKSSKQIPKMMELYNYFKERCMNAELNGTTYPITLVTGPTDVGKSTLCRFLLNYSARDGRTPLFIDLDVGQSSLSITGTFGVLPVNEPSDVNGKFDEQSMSVYYFGYKSPGHNMTLYKLLLEKIRRALASRLKHSYEVRTSGVLIDTCGWVDGGGYKLIKDIINILGVNMVLVLYGSSLYYKLKQDVSRSTEIIRVDKFRNVATRNRNVRADNRNVSIYEYFYGSSSCSRPIEPYTFKVNFNDIHIFKANVHSQIRNDNETSNAVPVLIEPSILYQVLALSYAESIEKILLSSIYGFVCIVELDMDSKVVTVLSPKAGPLPTSYLLMGDITLTPRETIS